jgi:hypothetical protein
MGDIKSKIIATERELARIDPALEPILGVFLRDKLARLQEILNRKDTRITSFT